MTNTIRLHIIQLSRRNMASPTFFLIVLILTSSWSSASADDDHREKHEERHEEDRHFDQHEEVGHHDFQHEHEDDDEQHQDRFRPSQCERHCPQGGQQVCGTDGKTYDNECSMRSESCRAGTSVTKSYDGPCRQNVQPCIGICLPFYIPVCGSNGKTYNNEMCMRAESCQTGTVITKSQDGPCRAVPQCDTDCPHGGSQICGTDGRTYANRCVMRMQSCRAGTFVRKDYNGPCRSFGSEQCMTNCPTNNSPVCGSDGKTYANECFMRAESCIERTFVTKSYDGACRNNVPRVCDTNCPANYQPVCGSDGKTYSNDCALRVASCQDGTSYTKNHDGPCQQESQQTCIETPCPNNWAPVCGTDRVTYTNVCQLRNRNCQLQKQHGGNRGVVISVAREGDC